MDDFIVSVIIPTLDAQECIQQLLLRLQQQTQRPDEIIVVDSSSSDNTIHEVRKVPGITLFQIPRSQFNHGGTRDWALRHSKGDFVLFLTQDAMPSDNYYVARLLQPFSDGLVAMTSGRQLPRDDARPFERLIRQRNYPNKPRVTHLSDVPMLGIKAFFVSDVCAAYRREFYSAVGGFEQSVLTNEDMLIAAKFLQSDYAIAYQPSATVIHSHNLSFRQQFRRNYLEGVEIARHSELLSNVSLTSEGLSLVKYVVAELFSTKQFFELPWFFLDCFARFAGNKLGLIRGKFISKR
ncbi:glycosyltransferase family 2 protein [Bifidobacterium psychraerophilum]|uniref:Glycosyl transferase, family 2 n=1 Tax=Bifidobacterium psychraerophilum TaxID=218140 RepID=A0A087CJ45_9BIFI|nr:glycosyltransferase [Bifidobacterium psychraerophilum]KFI83295.1 glycosyl transferase, family 2 [Bifidobacterium psychraerophilum]PKA94350.1 rhamnosyltransferase [Bifidobacterium psychraerophilum DSM 22366]